MTRMSEPTKKDVLDIAEYLGCNGEELWSEISKLLKRQHDYAIKEYLKDAVKARKEAEIKYNFYG